MWINFSVTHGGKNDVLQHQDTTKHDKAKKAQQHAPSMSSFVVRTVTEADQVSKAELKMSMLIAKNNIPFSFSDDLGLGLGLWHVSWLRHRKEILRREDQNNTASER